MVSYDGLCEPRRKAGAFFSLAEDTLTAPDRHSVMMLHPDDEKEFVGEENKK